jgi:hypothetical protein
MIVILNASKQPYISIGCKCGGVKLNGKEYIYAPKNDAFIRKDFMPKYRKMKNFDEFLELVKNEPKI